MCLSLRSANVRSLRRTTT